MNEFNSIDPILSRWANENKIQWLTKYKDYDVRTFFLNEQTNEKIQVWIDPPRSGETTIHIFQYKLGGKKKRSKDIVSKIDNIYDSLNVALDTSKSWT